MDAGGRPLPDTINPNNFPAKLWRLVNNPANKAIFWDSQGEAIVIDRHLFERQILSPGTINLDVTDTFKTTNFSSFVRQLNLYGFRKVEPVNKDSDPARDSGAYHHFSNPNFKRNHPELVASLRRLTADMKAKLHGGLKLKCRASRYQRFSGGDGGRDINVKRGKSFRDGVALDSGTHLCQFQGSSSLLSTMHQESSHPYHLNKAEAMAAHNGTPVPPQYLLRDRSLALSPTVFATDKGIPVSLSHHYAGIASSSNALHFQQGLLASANPRFVTFTPPSARHHPDYGSPVFQCYQPNPLASHLTGIGLQTGLFSPQSFYQARCPVNTMCREDHSHDSQHKEYQEEKKCDINVDAIFQIADEVLQTPPSSCVVRVVTPEKPGPVLVPSSVTCMLSDNPTSAMQGNPLHAGAESCIVDVVTYKHQEESVLSVPEQMPEDDIFEVTIGDAKDTEVIGIKVSNTAAFC